MINEYNEMNYYDKNASQFIESTFNVDMQSLYRYFLERLPKDSVILDVGCGSGRDSLAFKQLGYQVYAMDYSIELVKRAKELTGIDVQYRSFYDIDEHNTYDGIWACASLLHCERSRLAEVIGKLITALKPKGVLYMSFKYGNSDREKDGRQFTDLDKVQANTLLGQFDYVHQIQQWITVDKRPDRNEDWLNILLRKQG